MKVTGNDVGTVMKYSGHKTLESFSNYIHPTDEGRIVSMQALDNVDGILTAQDSVDGVRSDQSVKKRAVNRCKISKSQCRMPSPTTYARLAQHLNTHS
jgi:hypothetical protein